MKLFRKIHLWLSVPFGIIIALVCFSGAMLVFEQEITQSIRKDTYYVQSAGLNTLPIEQLAETVQRTLPDSVSVTGVTIFSDKSRTYQVNLSKPRRAAVFINQYTGEITGEKSRIGFFATMFKLHRWLLDNANPHEKGVKAGKLIVGISTLMFVISLLSGAIIWLPRANKNLRKSLSIFFKKGWPVFWRGLHVAGGMYALIIVLVMALTGLTWSFEWYRNGFFALCGVEQISSEPKGREEINKRSRDREPRQGRKHSSRQTTEQIPDKNLFRNWQLMYDEVHALNPGVPQISISKGSASVVLGRTGNGRASDKYMFDHNNGRISSVEKYADSESSGKLRGWIYALHTGSWGGVFTRTLWFFAALLGASLPLTGYYIWLKRLFRKK